MTCVQEKLFEDCLEKPAIIGVPTCEEYYAKRYREDWEYNKLHKIYTTTGVDNYVEQNPEYTKEDVEAKIETDDMFAKFFIKDPVQQSCYQKYCNEYISKYSPIERCIQLPASGKNALYCYKGKLCKMTEIPADDTKLVKSIDLQIEYRKADGSLLTIYASHKHTRKQGGNQNNQWYDLMHFSEHACCSHEANIIYVALADGPYYEYTADDGMTKMAHINVRANDHFRAMTTTDFIKWIKQILQ